MGSGASARGEVILEDVPSNQEGNEYENAGLNGMEHQGHMNQPSILPIGSDPGGERSSYNRRMKANKEERSVLQQNTMHTASISRMRLDDDFYMQITDEALKFLSKCNIPLLKHSSAARKEFLKYMESDRKQDIEKMFQWLQGRLTGNDDEFPHDRNAQILVLQLFPAFLAESSTFFRWLRSELGLSTHADPMDMDNIFESLYENVLPVDVDELLKLVKDTTLEKLPECKNILERGQWFETLANAVEGLPLAVIISIPDEKRGFPIVYCNKQVEILTGFSRDELHGSRTPFFFSPTEVEKAEELRSTLSCSLPIRLQLVTTFANSKQKRVLLFTKPLYDAHSRFRYVCTIMSKDTSATEIKRIGCFISSVPNVIYEETRGAMAS